MQSARIGAQKMPDEQPNDNPRITENSRDRRGVYENPMGSGIWWVHFYAAGKRHREKVGRKSDAIKLYQRKADVVAGRKLPELRNSKVVTLSELIDDVLEFVAHRKDNRSYESQGEIVRKALGSKPAADLTPQELERWLRIRCKHQLQRTGIRLSSHSAIARVLAMEKCPSIPPIWCESAEWARLLAALYKMK